MNTLSPEEVARKRRHRNERIVAVLLLLVCTGSVAGSIWWARYEADALERDRLYIPGNTAVTPEILLLQEFVKIDTSTPAGAAKGARWLEAYLRKQGIAAEVIASAPDRLNVYARIRGKNPDHGLLLFNHIDVMPPGPGWSTPPFAGHIGLNMLFGRGTLDMKALTICQLLAFVDVARSSSPPEHDLAFLATADEETGSEYGMQWLIANRPDLFQGIAFGITEGGITEMMREEMTYFGIEVGGKQQVIMTVEGDDLAKMQEARIALEPYMFAREPERVLPEVRRFFRVLSPTRIAFKDMLADIDQTIEQGNFWKLPASYRDLTQHSLWVTAPARSGSRWSMTIRQANLPDELPDARIAWILSVVQPYGLELGSVQQKQGPVPVSPEDTGLFEILRKEAERRYRVKAGMQLLYRSATDARFLRPRGVICYGISPFPVDFFQSISIHAANERIRLDYFMDGVDYTRRVIEEWARQKTAPTAPDN